MTQWRRFERMLDGKRWSWEVLVEGIRCFISWGEDGSRRGGSTTVTLNDEDHARRHAQNKIAEQLRKGFVEVEVSGPAMPDGDPDALVVDTIADALHKPAHGLPRPDYRPVDGFADVVCHAGIFPRSPGRGFYHYLVLHDGGRAAIGFNVQELSHDPDAVAALLELVVTIRDLPFDGRSHHKLTLPRPAGPFSHALLCSPALGRAAVAYPAIASRVATAFPIHDCEIGDADTEVLVDARIRGSGALRYANWAREPQPVVDLRFDVAGRRHLKEKTFKVYRPAQLHRLLDDLAGATVDSWLEVRSFCGEVRRVTPADLTPSTGEDLDRFTLGAAPV